MHMRLYAEVHNQLLDPKSRTEEDSGELLCCSHLDLIFEVRVEEHVMALGKTMVFYSYATFH